MIYKNVLRFELFNDAPSFYENGNAPGSSLLFYLQKKVDEEKKIKGKLDDEWEVLSDLVLFAKHDLLEKDMESLAISMFLLGQQTHIMGSVSRADSIDLLRSKMDREEPLNKKLMEMEAVSSIAQDLAIEVWKDELEEKLTLSDVCHEVYACLYRILSDKEAGSLDDIEWNTRLLNRLPNTADGLKKHLREVAPDYARKLGRRKK